MVFLVTFCLESESKALLLLSSSMDVLSLSRERFKINYRNRWVSVSSSLLIPHFSLLKADRDRSKREERWWRMEFFEIGLIGLKLGYSKIYTSIPTWLVRNIPSSLIFNMDQSSGKNQKCQNEQGERVTTVSHKTHFRATCLYTK